MRIAKIWHSIRGTLATHRSPRIYSNNWWNHCSLRIATWSHWTHRAIWQSLSKVTRIAMMMYNRRIVSSKTLCQDRGRCFQSRLRTKVHSSCLNSSWEALSRNKQYKKKSCFSKSRGWQGPALISLSRLRGLLGTIHFIVSPMLTSDIIYLEVPKAIGPTIELVLLRQWYCWRSERSIRADDLHGGNAGGDGELR
jgi:hypothetical protein